MSAVSWSNVAELLLADSSAALRCRVLVELLDVASDDPELADLRIRSESDREVVQLLRSRPTELSQMCLTLTRMGALGSIAVTRG